MGATPPHKLPAGHLKRLEQLKLIDANKGGHQLTPLGRHRYNRLPRPSRPGEIEQILSNVIPSRES
jgi:hypothetical protein